MKAFPINQNDAGQRLDRFVKKVAPTLPGGLLQRYIRIKRIKVNGKRAENNTILSPGDLVDRKILSLRCFWTPGPQGSNFEEFSAQGRAGKAGVRL